ncbi:MAG TPA: GYF domain-containing protein [Verrucomicrobiae bacterium]|nr:GYF domain-containing protein [Verrucomicrobiae bacterium]
MSDALQVHLARPGGEREGPFTLDQINERLTAKRIQVSDYWAWHEGLSNWVPLYEIEGVTKVAEGSAATSRGFSPLARSERIEAATEGAGLTSETTKKDVRAEPLLETSSESAPEIAPNDREISCVPEPAGSGAPELVAAAPAILERSEQAALWTDEPKGSVGVAEAQTELEAQETVEPVAVETMETSRFDTAVVEPCRSALCQGAEVEAPAAAQEPPEAVAQPPKVQKPHPRESLLAQRFYSGFPLSDLEQIFVFTTGDGRSVWESARVVAMLEAITGEELETIRRSTPRDVIFNCHPNQLLKANGEISDVAWRAMVIREPDVMQRVQAKLCRSCVCSFPSETGAVVALVLFYRQEAEAAVG